MIIFPYTYYIWRLSLKKSTPAMTNAKCNMYKGKSLLHSKSSAGSRHSPLELPTIFVLFDSAFAITEKVLYVEMRVFR
jgi:hypothetical protein